MTAFDYIVIAILAVSVLLGFARGMVKEVLALANLLIAFWVANKYGGDLVVYFDWASGLSDPMKALLGVATAFIACMIVGAILIALLGRLVSALGLGFFDRGMGALFGVARGLVIVMVLVTAAGYTSLPEQPFWQEASLSPMAVDAVREIKPHLPGDVAKWVRY